MIDKKKAIKWSKTEKMESLRICFCRSCKALDYAKEKCPRCSSADIVEASVDFLLCGTINNVERQFYIRDITKFSENIDYCTK